MEGLQVQIAFLAEYDALPGVGHGCGHNIIGTAAVGAGIAVSKLMEDLPGEIIVLGTPAEEAQVLTEVRRGRWLKPVFSMILTLR